MRKPLFLFLVVLFTTLAYAAPMLTSYDRDADLSNASPAMLMEMKRLSATETLTPSEQAALSTNQSVYVAPHITPADRDDLTVNPGSANNWTGTTDGTTITDNSEVRGYDTEDGWFCFDISGLPAGATVTNVQFNGYVNNTNYPYWSMTPLSSDPLTADAATLYADISAEASTGYYLYQNESSTYAAGWKQHDLGGTAIADCQADISQGWFAMGMASRDDMTTYYLYWDGWNQANPPYLVITYDPPVAGIGLNNGMVDPASGNTSTTYTYSVNYMHSAGTAPTTANVWIDGSSYPLTDPGMPYDNWATWTYSTTMPVGTAHEFYFEFDDGTGPVYWPTTAPTTPAYGPDVFNPLSGTYTVGTGGDYATLQAAFDALVTIGTDGNPLTIQVTEDQSGPQTLNGMIPGAGPGAYVEVYGDGDITVDGLNSDPTESAIWVQNSAYLWFHNFTVTNGGNSGLRVENSSNVDISHCNAWYNGWIGINFTNSTDCRAWNNFASWNYTQQVTMYDCLAGSNNLWYNNSIYGEGAVGATYHTGITVSASEGVFYNNTVLRDWNGGTAFGVVHTQNLDASYTAMNFDYNNYYTLDGCPMSSDSGGLGAYTTLADWQTGTGFDANSWWGDPYYADAASGDLHINVASTCYANGTSMVNPPVVDDYDGDARVMRVYDIGADVIVPPVDPAFDIAPNTYDYGTVNVGESLAQVFTITNTGGGTLTIADGDITIINDLEGNFNLDAITYPIDLTSMATVDITANFVPQSAGAKTADIQIIDNTTRLTHTVPLTGTGYVPTVYDAPYFQNFDTWALGQTFSDDWEQATTDQMDWTVDNNGTSSSATGPSDDMTGGGNYLYTETSGFNNMTAVIYSPIINLNPLSVPRLDFYYHMYGATMGSLTLDIYSGGVWTQLWTMSGDQGDQWNQAIVALGAYSGNVKFRFSALTGTSYTSDMAIDNFNVGEAPANPIFNIDTNTLAFPATVTGGTSAPMTATVTNIGGGTLTISDISITGTDAADFTFDIGGLTLPQDITTGSLAIDVTFAPTTVGAKTATMEITDNTRQVFNVTLTGSGYGPLAPPFVEDLNGTFPPAGWQLAGTYDWVQYHRGASDYCAESSFWNYSSGNSELISPMIQLGTGTPWRLGFDWSHQYSASYPLDQFDVDISTNGTTWTNIWSKVGTDLDSQDGAGSTTPGSFVTEFISLAAYSGDIWLRFNGITDYGPDLFLDNILLEEIPANPVYSCNQTEGAFGTVSVGNTGGPINFVISNTGAGTLTISDVSITGTDAGLFSYNLGGDTLPFDITSNTLTVAVAYAPTAEGNHVANLTITDNITRQQHIYALTGEGWAGLGDSPANPYPMVLAGGAFTDTGNNGDPFTDAVAIPPSQGQDVVYEVTFGSAGTLDCDLIGSDYDTKLAMYDVTVGTPDASNYLAYNDDFSGLQSGWTGLAVPAGTYWIVVDGYGGATGNYVINVAFTASAPDTPLNPTITVNGADIDLSWDVSAGATSYYVYRTDNPANAYVPIAGPIAATTYTDTGAATAGTTYFYYITASDDAPTRTRVNARTQGNQGAKTQN